MEEAWRKVLHVQNAAMQDKDYLALHEMFIPAQEQFTALYLRLPQEEKEVIGNYLDSAVALHHRLMMLACDWKEDERNAPLA